MGSHNLGSVENHVLCSASSVLLVLLLLPHRNLLWCLLVTRLENNSTPLLIKTTMRRMSCTSLAIYDCHYVDKIVYKDECVPYVEKTCYTQQEEHCEDMFEKNCTAVIDEFEERECFEVTELQCQLSESIQYEVVQESYTVLRCTRTSDRVCDTVYDLAISTRDDFQCIDVEHQYCWDEEKIIKDRTCTYSVDFECGKSKPVDGKGSVDCDKVPTKKCYDTPRKIREEVCKPRISKECKPVKRQVCDDCEKKKLRATCDKIQRNVCSYKPKEKCVDEPKKYCFKTEAMLHEKVCLSEKKVIVDETLSHV